MGKGDKKSKRGKIFKGSYGKRRPKKKIIIASESENIKSVKKSSDEKSETKV